MFSVMKSIEKFSFSLKNNKKKDENFSKYKYCIIKENKKKSIITELLDDLDDLILEIYDELI